MKVLAISYGKNLFDEHNIERARMQDCAGVVERLDIIVFARDNNNFTNVSDGNLYLYTSGGKTRIGMLIKAVILGFKILRGSSRGEYTITTQDPFEAGLVGLILARVRGMRLNIQEHGDFFSSDAWTKESFLNKLRAKFAKVILRNADSVRVVSPRIKNTLSKLGVSESKISLLSVSVPLNNFIRAAASDKARHLFSPDSIIVLSVARFVPQKNLSLLIEAFAQAHRQDARLRLLLIGAGDESGNLKYLVGRIFPNNKSEHIVEFLPWTNDVPAFMKSSDIYALSSNYEGYARVLLEAMSSGLPIVTTNVGCVDYVCKHEEHALVVPVGDTDAFASALLRLAQDDSLRHRLSEAGFEAASELSTQTANYADSWLKTL